MNIIQQSEKTLLNTLFGLGGELKDHQELSDHVASILPCPSSGDAEVEKLCSLSPKPQMLKGINVELKS